MNIAELRKLNVSISFEDIDTTIENLLSKKELKELSKEVENVKDVYIAGDMVIDYIEEHLDMNDITIDTFSIK